MFDDPNLVSSAGLVPMLRLAQRSGLDQLSQSRLTAQTDKGTNTGSKVVALVAGMLAGADSIDDMNLLRHGGMGRLFDRTYAPSTQGSFLREFRFGHVRQLDAVTTRTLVHLASAAPLLQVRDGEPVILGQRLRQGMTGSPKGAARIVGDALATLRRMNSGSNARPLLRATPRSTGTAPSVPRSRPARTFPSQCG